METATAIYLTYIQLLILFKYEGEILAGIKQYFAHVT